VLFVAGERVDSVFRLLPLPFQRERVGVSVRERMLHSGRVEARSVPLPIEEHADAVAENGEVVAHGKGTNDGIGSNARPPWAGRPILPRYEAHLLKTQRVTSTRALALVLLLFALGAMLPARAGAATLWQRLDQALTVPRVSRALTGALAVDLQTGRTVYSLHAGRSLEPASNQKLGVALAALDRLGPSYRVRTDVLGRGSRSGSVWRGRLVLKGYGDPTLSRADLRRMARRIHRLGIRRLTGRVVGDESYYDRRRTGPGWKPSWYKVESPPLSALVVNRARVNRRTVDNPARAAAVSFRSALVAAGIRVPRGVLLRAARPAVRLTGVLSPPVSRLVRRMDKVSDNFYAEMLLKHLGKTQRGAGTTSAGARVVMNELRSRGVPLQGVRVADGSGLSPYNRLTVRAVAALLISAWSDLAVRVPFVDSLPIAGVDGTLDERLTRRPAYRRVRAKTGTTIGSSALSGYVGSAYVFSVVQNGNPVSWFYARRAQNRFAQVLAYAAS
jgi:D-alanyl-D-alanine carboxypeptidase/D-alanyl-D-alanine-endopeptidase (penicillin-binding protein 4)